MNKEELLKAIEVVKVDIDWTWFNLTANACDRELTHNLRTQYGMLAHYEKLLKDLTNE